MLVELPLANSDNSILEIKPQDPLFQPFVSRCNAEFRSWARPATAEPPEADPYTGTPRTRNRPSAPGHSIDDTFPRFVEIVQENKSKGLRDSLSDTGWLTPFPVCYSVTRAVPPLVGPPKCDPTGESVRVPGDLLVGPEFWDDSRRLFYVRQCNQERGGLQVELRNGTNDGKKRFVTCMTAAQLSARRQILSQYGLGK